MHIHEDGFEHDHNGSEETKEEEESLSESNDESEDIHIHADGFRHNHADGASLQERKDSGCTWLDGEEDSEVNLSENKVVLEYNDDGFKLFINNTAAAVLTSRLLAVAFTLFFFW